MDEETEHQQQHQQQQQQPSESTAYPVPPSLPGLVRDFTRAVLRDQPADTALVQYAADYFRTLAGASSDDDDEESECGSDRGVERTEGTGGRSAGVSVCGRRHTQCEDTHAVVERGAEGRFFVVCDGHGGAAVARVVAHTFVDALLATRAWAAGDTAAALREACACVEGRLRTEHGQPPHGPALAAGCCAVAVVIEQGIVYVANVGDSRCVLVRRPDSGDDGDASKEGTEAEGIALSRDHRPGESGERQRLAAANVLVRGGRVLAMLAVSRSFGDLCLKDMCAGGVVCEPDVAAHKLARGDTALVLGSDGLWDVLSNADAAALVLQTLAQPGASCRDAAERLVLEAQRRGSEDDITALVVQL